MRVTVLMTLYNKGPYVGEAIRSVLAQTFADFELLVVDDASTDDGPAIVAAIGDPRIRLLRSAVNTGRAGAANRGYEAARGAYIAPMDADDIMLPERLAKQVAFLDAHPEVVAAGAWAQAFGAADHLIRFAERDAACRGHMLFGMPVLYGAAMFRRSVVQEHGIRSPEDWRYPAEDRLFMLQLGRHGQFANLQEVLLRYRLGEQNQRHGRNAVEDMQVLYRALFTYFNIPATGAEIKLQVFLHHDLGGPAPNMGQVWRLGAWIKRLTAYNRQVGIFPVAEFEKEVESRWSKLFYRVVDNDAASTLVHMARTGQLRQRFGYWAKTTKDRWLRPGSAPNRRPG